MATALSAETAIKKNLYDTQLDASRFCTLVGPDVLNRSRLGEALRGSGRQLDQAESTAALSTISKVKDLLELCDPLPIDLRNTALIRRLLAAQAEGKLFIDVRIFASDWIREEEQQDKIEQGQ